MTDVPTGLMFVSAPDAPATMNVLLYGPPGSGKSTAAATAPGPLLWVNAEGPGALAYARKVAAQRGHVIHEVRIDHETVDVAQTMRDVLKHVISGAEPAPATVVVDTVGQVREALARQFVNSSARDSRQQWGDVAKVIKETVRILRDADVNLILLAHESIEDESGDRIVRPAIGGALTEKIPADMDVVAYCGAVQDPENATVQYIGQLVEGRGRRAKDRSGALGVTRPLDMTEWLAAFRDALTPDDILGDEDDRPETPTADALDLKDFQPVAEKPLSEDAFAELTKATFAGKDR
jgi:AAA domain